MPKRKRKKNLADQILGKKRYNLGIRTGRTSAKKKRYNIGLGLGLGRKSMTRMKLYNRDTDRDGVPNIFDCRPFDARYHVRDPGDWMETEDPKPKVVKKPNGNDWIKKYKRRPREAYGEEEYVKDAEDYSDEAMDKYMDIEDYSMEDYVLYAVKVYLARIKGLKARPHPEFSRKNMRIFPYRKNTIELYDAKRGVYHYVDVSNPEKYDPVLLLSIVKEEKAKISSPHMLKRKFYAVSVVRE